MTDNAPSATEALAEFTRTANLDAAPHELRECAIRAIIDTVGVALAGTREESYGIIERTLPAAEVRGSSRVWATGELTAADRAALLNGTAAHTLDYDDVAEAIHTHPSAVMVPALLAMAEHSGASGREILDAFVVGYEVQTAAGFGMDLDAHFARGWHGTTSIAVLGGAAAVARLLHLSVAQIRNAIAIAASSAGGSRQNFGTMTKHLHAGMAARDSLISARLAQTGLTADQTQIKGPLGYLQNFGDGPSGAVRVVDAIQRPWSLLKTPLNIKPYPCCYRAARTALAAVQLHDRGIDAGEIERVLLTMEPRGTAPLIHHRPQTGLEGKFSAEYVLAAGLLDGAVDLQSFTDEFVLRPEAQDLLRHVEVVEKAVPPLGASEWKNGYATVELAMKDGQTQRIRVDLPHGHVEDPLTDKELEHKFLDCVRFSGLPIDGTALYEQLTSLDTDAPFTGLSAIANR